VLSNLDGYDARRARTAPPALADRWIRSRLAAAIRAVRENLRRYRFNDAASAVYQFLWHEFCDWYLEIAKGPLYRPASPSERLATQHALVTVLETTLRLLHPFMPFITEEIWQRLPGAGESIMIAPYPRVTRGLADPAAERDMAAVMEAVAAVRNIRGEMRIAPAASLAVTIRPAPGDSALFAATAGLVGSLARAEVRVDPRAARPQNAALAVLGASELYVDLVGVVDLAAERARLDKEIRRAADAVAFIEGKLGRPEFVERAPAEIVEKERQRLHEQRELHRKLEASLGWIKDGS
jgi:valyl-tRNA synthetase